MPPCKLRNRVLILSYLACCLAPLLEGQISIVHGDLDSPDSYVCSMSGLKGMGQDCGAKYDAMVFTAEILSIASAPDDEFRLTLRPEKVFKGAPTLGMEIRTAQWRCLPEMKIGDSWLFSLSRDEKSKELIVNYGSRSGPETQESQQIDLLNRLAGLDGKGVVKGRAYSVGEADEGDGAEHPSANHAIILTRVEDGHAVKAFTNQEGEFEFDAVPAGKYDLEPNTMQGLWTMWSGEIEVESNGCAYFDLDFHVDGQIAGRLIFPSGVGPSTWEVQATPVTNPEVFPASAWTDDTGRFVLHGLSQGKYIVVFKKTEMRDGPNLLVDLFAPGTPDRAGAQVIELGKASKVEGIEFVIPRFAMR